MKNLLGVKVFSGVDFTTRFARAIEQELKRKNCFNDIKEKNHG